ncbi:MAG: DUF4296 domain-containing protein, partial [Bacteroidota bacterium]|nr:DUF4296 domain-containing protein [Bacteroidota bacterium]
VFISCSNNKVPKGILPEPKMGNVLWDLIRADEFVLNYVHDSTRSKKQESIKLYQQVFQIHKITKEEFEKSFSFYKKHPEILQPLLDTLERRKKREIEKETELHNFIDTSTRTKIPPKKIQ